MNEHMITEKDIEIVNSIKEIIEPMTHIGDYGIDWEKAKMIETLERLVFNLKIAPLSYREVSEEDKAKQYFTAKCNDCGWYGSSKLLRGGGAIGWTGDYDDSNCPVCDGMNWDEKTKDE